MDSPGIEPETVQCECTGIPFTYKPQEEWTYRESNSELIHAMDAVYHLPIGPHAIFAIKYIREAPLSRESKIL